MDAGVRAWRQYVGDIQVWKEEYRRLALRFAAAMKELQADLPGGDLTANDWN